MSEEEFQVILDACKPTRVMMIGNYIPASPQENANRAWRALGDKMGFNSESVRPINGKEGRFFTAVPTETESQRADRVQHEAEEERLLAISHVEDEIASLTIKLAFAIQRRKDNGIQIQSRKNGRATEEEEQACIRTARTAGSTANRSI